MERRREGTGEVVTLECKAIGFSISSTLFGSLGNVCEVKRGRIKSLR